MNRSVIINNNLSPAQRRAYAFVEGFEHRRSGGAYDGLRRIADQTERSRLLDGFTWDWEQSKLIREREKQGQ